MLVLTANKGLIPLDSVVEGDLIYSANGSIKAVEKVVQQTKECVVLNTQNNFGSTLLPTNSKVLGVKRVLLRSGENYKQWAPFVHEPVSLDVSSLEAGDLLFIKSPEYEVKEIPTLDLGSGLDQTSRYRVLIKEVVENKPLSRAEKTRFKRFIKWDEQSLWVLGRFIACGWVEFDSNKNPEAISFGFEAGEREKFQKVQDFFQEKSIETVEKRYPKQGQIKLVVPNKLLAKHICELFPEHKHKDETKYLGDFKKMPRDLLRSLLLGLFSTVDESLQTTSKRLALDVREALTYLGVPSKVEDRKEIHRKNLDKPKVFVLKFKDIEGETEDKLIQEDGFYVRVRSVEKTSETITKSIEVSGAGFLSVNVTVC